MVFQSSLFVSIAGSGMDYLVGDSAIVAGGRDPGAPPCPVLGEAGLYAGLVAIDKAQVVTGLVFGAAEGLVEVDQVEHGLKSKSSCLWKSEVLVSSGPTSI